MIGLGLYNPPVDKIITISDDDLNIITNTQYKVRKSGYYNYWVSWTFKEFKEFSDNISIIQKAHFITMTATIKDELYNKYSKWIDVHKILLRSLYLEEGESDNVFSMGYKRPFGNSYVEGDVRDILFSLGIKFDDGSDDDNFDMENEILKSFSEFIIDFFNGGFELLVNSFESSPRSKTTWLERPEIKKIWESFGYKDKEFHPYMGEWIPCRREIRNKKLEKLGI